jgi:4-aminobutyrate aminotransferase-like enzyme
LIQGVGGVRPIPAAVLNCVTEMRRQFDCLLLVDEVQTGMFRTGPFVRCNDVGIQPDLLTFGKSTSDMMFPFAMTMYTAAIQNRLDDRNCRLLDTIRSRYSFETGLRSVLSTLRRAEAENLTAQVRARADLFRELLSQKLRGCPVVREVRCFGLLIGIELDAERSPHRSIKKLLGQLYLLAMLNDRQFPVLVGFCQYEPNVLKFTPPLAVSEDEVRRICDTIARSLRRSLGSVALGGLRQMLFPDQSRAPAAHLAASNETSATESSR